MSDQATCNHEDFIARVSVQRLLDSAVWYADFTLKCSACGEPMEFIGFPMGLSPGEPMVNLDRTELRIPFRAYRGDEARRRELLTDPPGFRVTAQDTEGLG